MKTVVLNPSVCAICGTPANAKEVYPANITPEAFTPTVFSARRAPDGLHYRMVRCNSCGLIRSDPVGDPDSLAGLYQRSSFDYGTEVFNLTATYGRYLRMLESLGVQKGSLLEIGCGNGFFLRHALAQGYNTVLGVEPSAAAREQALPDIRSQIVCDMIRPGLFRSREFDVICMFQVLDHISQPRMVLELCYEFLRPGGALLCLHHNVAAVSARILGERSPIVDVEHTFLFDPRTLAQLLQLCGYRIRRTGTAFNQYSLGYTVRLIPGQGAVKQLALGLLRALRMGNLPVTIPLGNLYAIAQKP